MLLGGEARVNPDQFAWVSEVAWHAKEDSLLDESRVPFSSLLLPLLLAPCCRHLDLFHIMST